MINEGYIKYRAERAEGDVAAPAAFEALNRCRTALHDRGLVGCYPNGIGYGNVSVRTEGEQFLISGSATGAARVLGLQQYALVRRFDLEKNGVDSLGRINASAESMSHGAVYRALPGVNAVIHVHSRRLFDYMRGAGYPETDPAIEFGTPELARAIQALVPAVGATEGIFVTAGHDEGVIAYGATVESALAQVLAACDKGGV